MPLADDDTLNEIVIEEDSVQGNVNENASTVEMTEEVLLDGENYSFNSYEGRLWECGRFYTVASPLLDASPSVHLSRHYFMLDNRVYRRRSEPSGTPAVPLRSSVDVKVEKLVHCSEANIQRSPSALPATLDDDASINKPEDMSGTSSAAALESEMHVGVHSPALPDGTVDPPVTKSPPPLQFVHNSCHHRPFTTIGSLYH